MKDIIQIGLTFEDFEVLIEGLEAIPSKSLGSEMIMSMLTHISTAGSTPKRQEQAKQESFRRLRELEKKALARADDLSILRAKVIMLKRLFLSDEALKATNDIIQNRSEKGSL